jgi:epithelial splicing regulatory protein 1/2
MGEGSHGNNGLPVRLRGLPFSAALNDVRDFLSGFDYIEDSVFLGINTFRGSPNGEAYAILTSEKARDDAIRELDRKQIGHRYIEIFSCSQQEYDQAKRKVEGRATATLKQ